MQDNADLLNNFGVPIVDPIIWRAISKNLVHDIFYTTDRKNSFKLQCVLATFDTTL
jgi:hypothetical protein